MRQEGTIVRWDDIRGFGFIRSGGVAQDVFMHVRDFRSSGEAARRGLRVSFERIDVGGKGPRAMAVVPLSPGGASKVTLREERARAPRRVQISSERRPKSHSGAKWVLPVMVAYGTALIWIVWHRQAPWWTLLASVLLNLSAFFAYWQDKYAAQNGRWRVKEATLHLWSLAGGWGGAWFAQQVLRHKSIKASFRAAYLSTVVIHCAAAFGFWWFSRAF